MSGDFPKNVLHIGIVKAASTTLQEHLFSRHSGLHHLGVPWRNEKLAIAFTGMQRDEVYDFNPGELRSACEGELHVAAESGRVASLSSESFSICDRANRIMLAERLAEAYGPAKVVAVLRNQLDWLSSRYVHNYVKPVPETRLNFDDWLVTHWWRDTFSYRHHADFDTMLRVYEGVFGSENVHVLLFEDLVADKATFVTELAGIANINAAEAVSLTAEAHNEKRAHNLGYIRRRFGILPRVSFRKYLPAMTYDAISKLFGGRMTPSYSEAWRREIEDYYRIGNARVAKRYGIDLGGRGYPV